ncbi:MAG: TetR/AcrR family transcriptional regulator [Ruminococcus sp.]|nr:TetR/AcrR family transcriptional regulator [Ruminococcus sp.]MBR1393960.1 TetR/AcrR family transcriptional regulator [Ruminococcus sp.]
MTKVDMKKKSKESSLLNTAFEFFTTKGFSKTSITDIASKAGVGKGTFYLYFKDKYDIRNKLISRKSEQVLTRAADALMKHTGELDFEGKFIFLVDNILNQLEENKSLLNFISKNLSWGVFMAALSAPSDQELNFRDAYYQLLSQSERRIREPELMLYMIVELVSSTCYSAILYSEPCDLAALKPELYKTIRSILEQFSE